MCLGYRLFDLTELKLDRKGGSRQFPPGFTCVNRSKKKYFAEMLDGLPGQE